MLRKVESAVYICFMGTKLSLTLTWTFSEMCLDFYLGQLFYRPILLLQNSDCIRNLYLFSKPCGYCCGTAAPGRLLKMYLKKYCDFFQNFGKIIVIRNGKTVWRVVWIEYCLGLNTQTTSEMYSNVTNECAGKSKQLYSLCYQLLGTLIYLHFIVLIIISF